MSKSNDEVKDISVDSSGNEAEKNISMDFDDVVKKIGRNHVDYELWGKRLTELFYNLVRRTPNLIYRIRRGIQDQLPKTKKD